MGNTAQAKEPPPATDAQPGASGKGEGNRFTKNVKELKKKTTYACCQTCSKIVYVVLAIIIILKSIAVMAVTVTTAIATKIYSSELSGRMVTMIILAVTAAVTMSIAIYAIVAVCRKKTRPLHAASIVLLILAIIQAIIAGVAVNVTSEDEISLSRSLTESFKLALEDNPRHVKIWATTQHGLNCCGVYGAEDYRSKNVPQYFPPDVAISCCPTYNPDRSELVQEREREICKAKKQYYDIGCRNLVLEVFKETAKMVLSVIVGLIVLEVIISLIGAILSREKDKKFQQKSSKENKTVSKEVA